MRADRVDMWTSRTILWIALANFALLKQCLNLSVCGKGVRSSRNANITIGGLFPVHVYKTREGLRYKDINYYGLSWTEAMLFAIDEINNSSMLLPNYSFGFDIRDSCNGLNNALSIAMDFVLNDIENNRRNECSCDDKYTGISAVIGGAASPISTSVANIFGVSNIPQISYSSTSPLLSDKEIYRSFLRTIPSDTYQAKSIADLLAEFKWTYVSVVASDNEYGRAGMDSLKIELKRRNICMAVEMLFHPNLYTQELTRIINLLKAQVRAKVIVLWCQRPNAIGFLEQATKLGLKGKTWIGTETWGDSYLLYSLSPETVGGMLGIVPELKIHQAFENHLKNLNPGNSGHNPWFIEYWKHAFNCQTFYVNTSAPDVNKTTNLFPSDIYFSYKANTDANVTIVCPRNKGVPSANNLPRNKCTNVMDAVHAVASSVKSILNCNDGLGLLPSGKCPSLTPNIKPDDLLIYIRNVSFNGHSGTTISFDKNGDLMQGAYAIKSLQPFDVNVTKMKFVRIGSWDGSDGKLQFIKEMKYLWNGWEDEMPNSRCTDICSPGQYSVQGSQICCWSCVPCPKGTIKSSRGLEACVPCPAGYQSNTNRTMCLKRTDVYMSWSSARAICVITMSIIGILHGLFILSVFIRYRSTAVVKASNRELSLIHLSFLIACYLFTLCLIGEPTPVRCGVRSFIFSTLYTVTTSITLLKTDRLLRIFRSKSRLSSQSRLLTNKMQLITAAALTLFPLIVASMWVIVRPPAVTMTDTEGNSRLLRCSDTTDSLLVIILSYVLALAVVSTYFAYKARQLPENFNEAKFIGLAMFSFCVFWIGFLPVFYSSTGANRTFVHCITVLSSTISVTCIMYYPKLRIILFYPNQNKPEVFRINASTVNLRIQGNSQSSSTPRVTPLPSPFDTRKENYLKPPSSPQLENRRLSAVSVGGGIVYS